MVTTLQKKLSQSNFPFDAAHQTQPLVALLHSKGSLQAPQRTTFSFSPLTSCYIYNLFEGITDT